MDGDVDRARLAGFEEQHRRRLGVGAVVVDRRHVVVEQFEREVLVGEGDEGGGQGLAGGDIDDIEVLAVVAGHLAHEVAVADDQGGVRRSAGVDVLVGVVGVAHGDRERVLAGTPQEVDLEVVAATFTQCGREAERRVALLRRVRGDAVQVGVEQGDVHEQTGRRGDRDVDDLGGVELEGEPVVGLAVEGAVVGAIGQVTHVVRIGRVIGVGLTVGVGDRPPAGVQVATVTFEIVAGGSVVAATCRRHKQAEAGTVEGDVLGGRLAEPAGVIAGGFEPDAHRAGGNVTGGDGEGVLGPVAEGVAGGRGVRHGEQYGLGGGEVGRWCLQLLAVLRFGARIKW